MFEKVLQSVQDNPTEERVQAFLRLVLQVKSASDRATVLAQFGEILLRHDAVRAMDILHYAFRLSPKAPAVRQALEGCLLQLERTKSLEKLRQLWTEPLQIERSTKQSSTLQIETKTSSALKSVPEPIAQQESEVSLDFSLIAAALGGSDSIQKASVREADTPYMLFRNFFANQGLDPALLEHADEFADSYFGLARLLISLAKTHQISEETLSHSSVQLRALFAEECPDTKTLQRFDEIFLLALNQKSLNGA